jgi:hypothetical protein
MRNLWPVAMMLAIIAANTPALMRQWRDDRAGSIKTIWLLLAYLAYCGLAAWLVIWLAAWNAPAGNAWKALALTVAAVGFIFYGALTLMRVVPRYREPPAWLMRFGLADILILGGTFLALALYDWA